LLDSDEGNLGNNDQLFAQHSQRRHGVKGLESSDEPEERIQVTPIERLHGAARLESSGYLRVVEGDADIASKHGIKGSSEIQDIDDEDDLLFSHTSKTSSQRPTVSEFAQQQQQQQQPSSDNGFLPPIGSRVLYSAVHELLDPERAERAQRLLDADLRELAQASPDDDQVQFAPPELTPPAATTKAAAPRSAATAWYDIDEGAGSSGSGGPAAASTGMARRRLPEHNDEDDEDDEDDNGAAALFREDEEAEDEGSLEWDEPLVELKQPAVEVPKGLELHPKASSTRASRVQQLPNESADEDSFDENDSLTQQGAVSSFNRILQRETQRRENPSLKDR
jgi:hypothetical protein